MDFSAGQEKETCVAIFVEQSAHIASVVVVIAFATPDFAAAHIVLTTICKYTFYKRAAIG